MRKITILFLLAFSFEVYSQNENYIYKNEEFGVEVMFPSQPTESAMNNDFLTQRGASLIIFSADLSYILIIQKSGFKLDMAKGLNDVGKVNVTNYYVTGDKEVTEFEFYSGGSCSRYKTINYKGSKKKNDFMMVALTVSGQSRAQDKDVFPFFNSIKISDGLVVSSNTDINLFKNYAITYATKTDTVKQIVYINNASKNAYQYEKLSDIDKNIPQSGQASPYRFALIIGNEDYSSNQKDLSTEINVDFAKNDASAFKEYAINTLGIPDKNVIFLLDATTGQMNQGISKMNLIIKNTQGNAEAFVYYAGHGLPDEQTKETYIMPVDISGKNAADGIKLKDMYSKLSEYPSKRVSVFIDACFSGGARNQALLSARGVKVRPKEDMLNGNIVVFTASSGDQSSLAYEEKKHGFFTYFLLKKLQESNGSVSYGELSKYLMDNVSLQSVLINDKEQVPQVNVSNSIIDEWANFKMK